LRFKGGDTRFGEEKLVVALWDHGGVVSDCHPERMEAKGDSSHTFGMTLCG
jgi:hypothetical protein